MKSYLICLEKNLILDMEKIESIRINKNIVNVTITNVDIVFMWNFKEWEALVVKGSEDTIVSNFNEVIFESYKKLKSGYYGDITDKEEK